MQRSVTSWPYKTLANVTRQIPRIMARLSPPGVQSPALKKSLFEGSFQGRQRAITSLALARRRDTMFCCSFLPHPLADMRDSS